MRPLRHAWSQDTAQGFSQKLVFRPFFKLGRVPAGGMVVSHVGR
jgi:hypothetical protein